LVRGGENRVTVGGETVKIADPGRSLLDDFLSHASSERGNQPMREPSPDLFFETVNAYQRSMALKAAIELDVFSAVAEGCATPAAIAARCGASERGIRVLCDYLTILGFLRKSAPSYALTEDCALFLVRSSRSYVGASIEFLLAPGYLRHFDDPTAFVRKGGTALTEQGTTAPDHPMWVAFARSMGPVMMPAARGLSPHLARDPGERLRVLDIAAGHGMFGITLAQRFPHAHVTAIDWPAVLEVARQNAAAHGVTDRYRTLEGSAFEVDFGGDYDLVVLANFLHHFDVATCEALLRKVHAALAPGGQVATIEFIPREDRISPPGIAAFSFNMLGTTPHGDAYTFAEYEAMFLASGFGHSQLLPLGRAAQQLVLTTQGR
jgi:SAM-dependent methyltransferase